METSQPPAHTKGSHNHPGKTKGTLGDNQDNTITGHHQKTPQGVGFGG